MCDPLRGRGGRQFGSDSFHVGHLVASSAQGSFVAVRIDAWGWGKKGLRWRGKEGIAQVATYLYPQEGICPRRFLEYVF